MAASDILPVDPDYAVVRGVRTNVIESRSEGGKVYRRIKAAPQRIFVLAWVRRSLADMQSLENWHRKFQDDFFTFDDKVAVRKFSVFPAGEPAFEEVGNEQHNCRWELIEAIGKPLNTNPTSPLGNNIASSAQSVGNSKFITYAGYGFTATYSGTTDIKVDGVSIGNPASPLNRFTEPLNLHRVEFVGATPPTITNFQAVI